MANLSPANIVNILQQLSDDNSGNGGSDSDVIEDSTEIVCTPSSSDSESDDQATTSSSAPFRASLLTAKDGTSWSQVTSDVGRAPSQNVFRNSPGITHYCRNIETALDAWRVIIDEGCLRHIKLCTEEFAKTADSNWKMEINELEKFIGLLYLRGAMNNNNFPGELLWSQRYGAEAFRSAMSRNRFRSIKKFIRFDKKSERRRNLVEDKFCLISYILNRFTENSQKAYIPEYSLTVDEQLFPTKTRCRFTQYMPNKPDKFGIKFWILAEVSSKYCYNIQPYLGKDENRHEKLGTHVVMNLCKPLFGQGYNLCTDNFFTSKDIALKLMSEKTSLVGTVRSNKRELPKLPKLSLFESYFLRSGQMHLTIYQAKKNKTVNLLSTLHKGKNTEDNQKKKSESIIFYNKNKVGVDALDSMCRQMTTKAACRRWPLAVFCNILDLSAINAWILFCKKTSKKISRRVFLVNLADELCGYNRDRRPLAFEGQEAETLSSRVNCSIKANCVKNRTVTLCIRCRKPVCGQCMAKLCSICYSTMA